MRSLLVAICVAFVTPSPLLATDPDSLEAAQQFIDQGKFKQALTTIRALQDKLPANAKLAKWTIDLRQTKGYPCDGLLIGKKYLYFIVRYSRRSQPPLGVPDARPVLNDTRSVYDFNTMITCVAGSSGKKLWSRHVAGGVNLALDPRTDDMLVWRKSVIRLSADKGEVRLSKEIPAAQGRVDAIIIDGQVHVARREKIIDDRRIGQRSAYNETTGAVAKTDVVRAFRLAPDEKKVLALEMSQSPSKIATLLKANRLDSTPLWSYEYPGYIYNEPFWHEDDVIALNGSHYNHGEVVRLEGKSGKVRWRFTLPRGPYCAGSDQLLGNAYQDPWNAIGMAGKSLLAIGGEATLYFLDPNDGKLQARVTPLTTYLAFPRIIADALIVGSQMEIRAIPLDTIFDKHPGSEKHLLLLEAKCLKALGQTKKSLELLDTLLEQMPEVSEGWLLRAQLCKELQLPLAEIACHCKYLALTKKEVSAELRQHTGLIKRLATDSNVRADLLLVVGKPVARGGLAAGDIVYAGTPRGDLYAIDSRSLEVVEKTQFPAAIYAVSRDEQLYGGFSDRGKVAIEAKDPAPANAPPEWNTVSGYDGLAVRWRGKYYRPRKGGHVSVLDGNKVQNFQTSMEGIEAWNIHVSPFGPVGYGHGGVYQLDKNLCPVRMLIPAGPNNNLARLRLVVHVADNAETICMMVSRYSSRFLQIWTRDGKKMLREVELSQPVKATQTTGSLLSLNGGYLYTGIELVWLSPSPDKAPWRFGVGDQPGRGVPKLYYEHTSYFGRPLPHNNFLFVTCRDGGIYIFDLAAVTK